MSEIDKSMSETEIRDLLGKAEVGRVGLFGGNDENESTERSARKDGSESGERNEAYPYIVPVNYAYLNGNIYFHGAFRGKKIDLMKKNGNVCFEVDTGHALEPGKPGDCSFSYRSVIVCGKARLLEKHETELFMSAAQALFEKYASSHVPEITEKMIEKTQMVEIEVVKATGKKSKDQCRT